MTLTRRRFLALTAVSLAAPAHAAPIRWQGYAMGAECTLTLYAPRDQAETAIRAIRDLLHHTENRFSLYHPTSELSTLNQTGTLYAPSPDMIQLLSQADQIHRATAGRFDPTIQPLWQALAQGQDPTAARALIGWHHVQVDPHKVTLAAGQALTLNGIAQGYVTDQATQILRDLGLTQTLINLGEFQAIGGPFTIGLSDPAHGLFGTRTLTNSAIATSSPGALQLNDNSHILAPNGQTPHWSTVTVEATSATLADAASTAFCLMTAPEIAAAMANLPGLNRTTLMAKTGQAQTLQI